MVGAQRSTTGHPLFVAGPQIGYFYPGLTLEADIQGPGFESRGVYSPANPGDDPHRPRRGLRVEPDLRRLRH